MSSKDLPLGSGGFARLAEDLGWDGELANVVKECSPTESVEVFLREAHLLADHIGVGANPLGVTAGQWLMLSQLRNELDRLLGGHLCVATQLQRLLGGNKFRHAARTQGHLESRWSVVGKDEAHLVERNQGRPVSEESDDDRRYRNGDDDGLQEEYHQTDHTGEFSSEPEAACQPDGDPASDKRSDCESKLECVCK